MSDSRPVAGHLVRLTRRLQLAAIVSVGWAAFCHVIAVTTTSHHTERGLLAVADVAAIGAVVFGAGAVVGRLLITARRDDEERVQAAPSESSQNWYQ
jgi:hypothetical protein